MFNIENDPLRMRALTRRIDLSYKTDSQAGTEEHMPRAERLFIGILIVACALISACSRRPETVGPRFTGRLLLFVGSNTDGSDLMELSATPAASPNYSLLTKGVFEAVASPDRSQLLFTTKDEILLRDLHTGAVKPLIKGENFCLTWSPDGKRFAYKQKSPGLEGATSQAGLRTKLFVSDMDGKAKVIWEDLVADYGNVSNLGQASVLERAAATSGCAQWIAPDRFIFERFLGAFTRQKKGSAALEPNTTTLVILTDPVKFVDTERKWSIESTCQEAKAALLRSHDQVHPILMARGLSHPEALDLSPVSCSGCRFVGFAAQSCVPFFIEDGPNNSSELFYLNPTNWQRQRGAHIGQTFSATAKMLIKSSARLMIVGDVPGTLLLIDTESGEAVPLFPKSAATPGSDASSLLPRPIVWIED